MNEHDSNYKQLFSHAQLIKDLLKGFVKEDWVKELDFSSLEKVNASYISDDLRDRADDIIWKVRWGNKDVWLFTQLPLQNLVSAVFKLELSRTPADFMAMLDALLDWIKEPAQASLDNAFTTWITQLLLPKRLPEAKFDKVINLQEMRAMLADRTIIPWTEQWKAQGLTQGLKQGLKQGFKQGQAEGWAKGRAEGEARLLIRSLERKFGSLDDETWGAIYHLDENSLLDCIERLATAQTVDEVLGN